MKANEYWNNIHRAATASDLYSVANMSAKL